MTQFEDIYIPQSPRLRKVERILMRVEAALTVAAILAVIAVGVFAQ